MVQTFGVNSLNELTNVTRSGTLTVAGFTTTNASSVTVNGSSATRYGTPLLVIQERDANNLPTANYTRGLDLSGTIQGAGGIGGLLALTTLDSAAVQHYCYHSDGSGNVTALVNDKEALVARYLYDPYGNILARDGPMAEANLYRFSSKELHAQSGLVYYGFRYYEPALQRWVNRDPADIEGGINLFRFAGNDGLCMVDAWGLQVRVELSGGTSSSRLEEAVYNFWGEPTWRPINETITTHYVSHPRNLKTAYRIHNWYYGSNEARYGYRFRAEFDYYFSDNTESWHKVWHIGKNAPPDKEWRGGGGGNITDGPTWNVGTWINTTEDVKTDWFNLSAGFWKRPSGRTVLTKFPIFTLVPETPGDNRTYVVRFRLRLLNPPPGTSTPFYLHYSKEVTPEARTFTIKPSDYGRSMYSIEFLDAYPTDAVE